MTSTLYFDDIDYCIKIFGNTKKNTRKQQKSVTSTVKGLIVYQGKLLFIKKKVGSVDLWDLPGGRVRYGEDPITGLKRHMIEEICIGGVIRHSLGIRQRYHAITKDYTLCHTYICSITENEYEQLCSFCTFKEQISKIAWVTIDAIKDQTFDIGNNSLRSLLLANIRALMERDDGPSPTQTN